MHPKSIYALVAA